MDTIHWSRISPQLMMGSWTPIIQDGTLPNMLFVHVLDCGVNRLNVSSLEQIQKYLRNTFNKKAIFWNSLIDYENLDTTKILWNNRINKLNNRVWFVVHDTPQSVSVIDFE